MTTMNELLIRHRAAMLAFARRKARGSDDVADDMFQTACLFALQSKVDPDSLQRPKNWLLGVVKNAARSLYRTESRYDAGGDEIAAETRVDGAQEASVELAEVATSLAGMSDRRQDAVYLVAFEGRTIAEAARIMGVWPYSVERHLKEARATFSGETRIEKPRRRAA